MPEFAATQFSGIFVSYRRDDSAGHAGRLFDRLSEHFGRERLFMDVDHIEPGEDFVQVIEAAVGSSAVLLVVIGRRWLTSGDMTARRLDNPNDFVRLEVAAALASNVRVIPVLVQDATMPGPQELPDDLVRLSRRNAIELSDLRWNRDVDQLISVLERFFAKQQEAQGIAEQGAEKEPQRAAEAERQRVEEQLRQQAERTARATEENRQRGEAEEFERRHAVERLSPTAAGPSSPARPDVSLLNAEWATHAVVLPSYVAERPKKSKLPLMIAGVALVVLIGLALVVWLARAAVRKMTPSTVSQPQSTVDKKTSSLVSQPPSASQTQSKSQRIELVLIPKGSFMMGATHDGADEGPVRRVTISHEFYIGKYEVTQAQWQAVMGNNPSAFKGADLPVDGVSWNDAIAFVARLNAQGDGYTYRLPSEAEWEYAARAGTTGDYAGDLDAMAWYDSNSGKTTHPVGGKQPNGFGLYDMHGNVWEWCQDWYHASNAGAPTDGSAWLSGGEQKERVLRGGSWGNFDHVCRSARRFSNGPDNRNFFGLRVVAVARK